MMHDLKTKSDLSKSPGNTGGSLRNGEIVPLDQKRQIDHMKGIVPSLGKASTFFSYLACVRSRSGGTVGIEGSWWLNRQNGQGEVKGQQKEGKAVKSVKGTK